MQEGAGEEGTLQTTWQTKEGKQNLTWRLERGKAATFASNVLEENSGWWIGMPTLHADEEPRASKANEGALLRLRCKERHKECRKSTPGVLHHPFTWDWEKKTW
jgi:hypothetical protein